jgi:hypothetical protein
VIAPIGPAPVPAAGAATSKALPAGRFPFGEVLRRLPPGVEPAASAAATGARVVLERVDRAREQLDRALAQARAGRTFSAQELLALQVDAYRFNQLVEVASKVAEAGAQVVRQSVNTQV